MGLLGTVSTWAADYVVTGTRTYSDDMKTSTWSELLANNGAYFQSSQTAEGIGTYFVASGKITLGGGHELKS